MAVTIFVAAVAGFSRTYFLKPLLPEAVPAPRELTPLIHLHAALFTGWLILLLVQTKLVATQRIHVHRNVGVVGAVLAAAMLIVGTLTALHGALRGVAPFGMDPLRFLIIPLAAVVLFAAFVTVALLRRRDPQSHKRWMLLATVALLPPVLARLVRLFGLGPPFVLGLSMLFIVPLFAWDLKTRGRLHPVTLWGGLLLIASVPLRLALAQTDAWLRIASWLVRLVA
jgi:hypothetical protein